MDSPKTLGDFNDVGLHFLHTLFLPRFAAVFVFGKFSGDKKNKSNVVSKGFL
jgi:hypothetical protein